MNNGRTGIALAAVFGVGCLMSPGCGPKAVPLPTVGTAASSVASSAASVQLKTIDRAAYDAAIANLHGKVVLVDFWATWCEPCVEQLPHTLALGEQSRDRGLAVVTVSCDEPAESERVAAFLTSKNAGGATNLISQFGGSPRTMEELEISSGAVPFYKLYDRAGRIRQTFGISPAAAKQFTTGDIEAAVEQLLAE
jgi:thiol-disulfide isomerase/thioredoxin